jgi:hypothetical protein
LNGTGNSILKASKVRASLKLNCPILVLTRFERYAILLSFRPKSRAIALM